MDGPSPAMDRFATDRAFRHINGYASVQRGRHATDAALPRLQGRITTCGVPHGLFVPSQIPPSVPGGCRYPNNNLAVNMRDLAGVSQPDEDEVMRVSMITVDVSQGNTNSHSNNSQGIQDYVCPERGKQHDLSAHMDFELCVKVSLRNLKENCFGVCGLTHRLNRPEIDWCCECIDRLIWGYRVSCVVTFVTKNRSVGIDVFIKGSCVYASTRGLEDGPIRPCDVIPVYVWMTKKFKDVLNKVMLVNKAPVNSHGLQRGGDNGQVRGTRASVDNRLIRVAGRFGCLYSPFQGADWLDGGGPVGKDVWIGYIGDGFSQYQSPDAAPLTELQDLNTLLHSYSDCSTGFYLIWTVSITVRISLGVEEVTSCCGELLPCQTMDGAALADDRSGVTFTAELCVPWDAPEAVIDINSTDLISLGSFPDKVGLFGRRKECIMATSYKLYWDEILFIVKLN